MRTYEITKPIWENIVEKNRIIAKLEYSDGDTSVITFPVDENNATYQEFLEKFTHEDVDANTEDVREKERAAAEAVAAQKEERFEQDKLNKLFNTKIQAFELDVVQNSTTEQKARIRKAKSNFEVTALVAALFIQNEEI